jgi:curved DNA-binding protein CbpA
VRARLQLVDEGDYFAVLGVARDATGYEVRRAFLELRRAFEPSRVLTPSVADLADDVRKIVSVLEEAYEILKDGARRERYRRAIDAVPT